MARRPVVCALMIFGATGLLAACGSAKQATPPASSSALFVPWRSIGDIRLGESMKQVRTEYGREGDYGYRLHGGLVDVESNFPPLGRVNWIYFTSRFYRTKSGFG